VKEGAAPVFGACGQNEAVGCRGSAIAALMLVRVGERYAVVDVAGFNHPGEARC